MEARVEGVGELPDFAVSIADGIIDNLVACEAHLFVNISKIATALHEICSAPGIDGLRCDVSDHVSFLREFMTSTDLEILFAWLGFEMNGGSVEYVISDDCKEKGDVEGGSISLSSRRTLAKKRLFNSYLRGKLVEND
jgi:hypothetical protein